MGTPGVEARILDATKLCCTQWGVEKVTVDDIAVASGVSRATLYRLFPGGKDILFEALRVRELNDFFDGLISQVQGIDDLEELVVQLVVESTKALRSDEYLAIMLATEPGETLGELTVEGLPRILRVANEYLEPFVEPFVGPDQAASLIDLMVRATISYFLAPSEHFDLGSAESARRFIHSGVNFFTPSTI